MKQKKSLYSKKQAQGAPTQVAARLKHQLFGIPQKLAVMIPVFVVMDVNSKSAAEGKSIV
ncbi:MAG: hypothetical protein ABJJ91_07300 [Paraglaciecola sp.]